MKILFGNGSGMDNIQRMNEILSGLEVPDITKKEEAWEKFLVILSVREKRKPVRTRSLKNYLAYAASIAILFSIGLFYYFFNNVEENCFAGNLKTIELPDHSIVEMNSGSKICYNKIAWNFKRNLALEGEAFFKVRKGKAFSVNAEDGKVTVMGTSFNVYSRSGVFAVSCKTGLVKVSANEKKPVLLKAGMKLTSNNLTHKISKLDVHDFSWRNGEFWYTEAPLQEVLDELGRQFAIDIKNNTTGKFYTGYFRNTNLPHSLEMVLLPLGLDYKIENNIYIIENRN